MPRGAKVLVVLAVLIAAGVVLWLRPWERALRDKRVEVRWRRGEVLVERCTSCHEEATHPAAILAKHPADRFGCTACHGGNAAEASKRAHEGLRKTEDDVPLREGGCGQCHARGDLPGAPLLSLGRELYRAKRCASCHSGARDAPMRAPGPPLDALDAKTTPEHVIRFLRAAKNAGMPNFWPAPVDPQTRAPLGAGTPQHAAWLARRDSETASLAAFLFSRSDAELGARIARRANVPGASADDGKRLYEAIGCASCHAQASLSLEGIGSERSEDWLAWFLEDPARAHPKTAMPSLRLDRRASASVAKYLATRTRSDVAPTDASEALRPTERVVCTAGEPKREMTRAECGAALFSSYGCGSCHASPDKAKAFTDVPLAGYAAKKPKDGTWTSFTTTVLAAPRVFAPVTRRMPDHGLTPDEVRALTVYLSSLGEGTPDAAFDPYASVEQDRASRGRDLMKELACSACHGPHPSAPSLEGEGTRVRASWLATFLRDPSAHGVRPALHPEWVWGPLVPPDRLALRMPTFTFEPAEIDLLVRALDAREGPVPQTLADKDAKDAKDLRACSSCHYIGELPIERAKTSLATLAPDLAQTSARLRFEWVRGLLAAPRTLSAHASVSPHEADAERLARLLFTLPTTAPSP